MASILGHDGFSEWTTPILSDTMDLQNRSDALWVTQAGNLTFLDMLGQKQTIAVVASTFWPVPVVARRIYVTGTTAAVIVLRK